MSLLGDLEMAVSVPPYNNKEQFGKAFHVLNMMRQENVLTDVIVSAGNRKIKAHRAVLASASPYFYAMFTGDLSESRQEMIVLKEIDPKALELLVEYCYKAEVQVNEENVQVCDFVFD